MILFNLLQDYISIKDFQTAQHASLQRNCTLFHILLSHNLISNSDLLRTLALHFDILSHQGDGLIALKSLEPQLQSILDKKRQVQVQFMTPKHKKSPVFELIDPRSLSFLALSKQITRLKNSQKNIILTDTKSFHITLENRYQDYFTHGALYNLRDHFPNASACTFSSHSLSKRNKGAFFSLMISLLLLIYWVSPFANHLIYLATFIVSPLFIALIILRFSAIFDLDQSQEPTQISLLSNHQLPTYTILVPLYQEEKILPSLIKALKALNYPKEKLDIKLLLEEDDLQTQRIAQDLNLPDYFECLIIPYSLPKTKPKALNYALPFVRGEYLVIYDAEDRPQQNQLKAALQAFAQGAPNLACVQAKLGIYNTQTNWLTKQFTLEYNALFKGILPTLSKLNLPFLLGGTSNHFKTTALKNVGGWDAFNVTEDADLGIRLYRFGYCAQTIHSTTLEESCTHFSSWLKQRTRWLKGWMQTYCVHMKHPVRLWQDLGVKGFLCFQILLGGQILASISYPIFVLFTIFMGFKHFSLKQSSTLHDTGFLSLSLSLFFLSYVINGWLGYRTTTRNKKNGALLHTILTIPIYWFMISLAAIRALYQLFTRPFHWEKTPHGHSLKTNKTASK